MWEWHLLLAPRPRDRQVPRPAQPWLSLFGEWEQDLCHWAWVPDQGSGRPRVAPSGFPTPSGSRSPGLAGGVGVGSPTADPAAPFTRGEAGKRGNTRVCGLSCCQGLGAREGLSGRRLMQTSTCPL